MKTLGVILAAGLSSRMGRPKALLATIRNELYTYRENETFLARSIAMMERAGVDATMAVANPETESAVRAECGDRASVAVNGFPEAGMVSSLLCALDAAVRSGFGKPDRILMTLVDTPMVDPGRARAMLAFRPKLGTWVLLPRYDDGQGHPVVLYRGCFSALRQPLERGLKTLIAENPGRVAEIRFPGRQPRDIDTPEDYLDYRGSASPG